MAKHKKKPTKAKSSSASKIVADQITENSNPEIETSDIMLAEVKTKKTKQERKNEKAAFAAKQKKKAKNDAAPRRHRVKELFSELKKVNWPTFGKTCKQTGTVLAVVVIFMLVVLGLDSLLGWLITLIGKI